MSTAREDAIYTARNFASRAIPADIWDNDDVLRSVQLAGGRAATLLRDLFNFIDKGDFSEDERLSLLYDDADNAPSMRNGALSTLAWIQDRIAASAPDLAGVVFRWVGLFSEALAEYEPLPDGRNRAADLAFELLLRSLPAPVDGNLGAYAHQYADLAARIVKAFGPGAGTGVARATVLRLLQAHYAKRPIYATFRARGEMQALITAYWANNDIQRAQGVSVRQQLKQLRVWWRDVAAPNARRFIAVGADPALIIVPSANFKAERQAFGDVWVQSLEREILEIARCENYDEHIALLHTARRLMRANLAFAETEGLPYVQWIGLRMQQKIMRALTVIIGAGSPRIEVAQLKRTLDAVLGRFITPRNYDEVRRLLGEDELALLRAFTEPINYTYGNPRQAWHALSLDSEAEVQWMPEERLWVLKRGAGDV